MRSRRARREPADASSGRRCRSADPAHARIDHESVTAARLTFAMARHAVVDLCAVYRLDPTLPRVDRLAPTEEKELERLLGTAGIPLRTDEACIAKFRALRASYEPYVHTLSSFLLMPLPGWLPTARESESWHTTS